jgi:hypothetical protein
MKFLAQPSRIDLTYDESVYGTSLTALPGPHPSTRRFDRSCGLSQPGRVSWLLTP